MISGIGCDIIEIARIEKSIASYGSKFLHKIYSDDEIKAAPPSHIKMCAYFANRFAAKEAFAKALGTGIGNNIKFREIEILKHPNGQPYIKYPERLGNLKVHVSISDEKQHSLAFVILEILI